MSSKKDSVKPKGLNNGSSGNSAPNAWSRPLQTRPPPGLDNRNKPKSIKDKILRERFLHLSLSLVGQKVTVTQTNGTVLEGIFHTFTPFDSQPLEKRNKYVIKTVQVIVVGSGDSVEIEKGSTVIVPLEKVTFLHAKSMRLGTSNGNNEVFRTDVEISSQQSIRDQTLVSAGVAWTPVETSANGLAESLVNGSESIPRTKSSSVPARGTIGEWDQFQANEELFNVKGSYDENLYTTKLNKSLMDPSKQQEAERLAHEIESEVSTNIHITEERNQLTKGVYDEEDLYSGVLRKTSEVSNNDIPQRMNYAAAAAASAQRKPVPPGPAKAKDEEEKKDTKDAPSFMKNLKSVPSMSPSPSEVTSKVNVVKVEHKEKSKVEETPVAEEKTVVDKIEMKHDDAGNDLEKSKEKESDTKLKLNANAKSFSFNPTAKTFTPTSGSTSAPVPVLESPMIDPHTGMAIIPHMMGHYIPHQMVVQPGMMPGMHNQFATIRYPGPYSGMEHHMGHIPPHHQPQHHILTSHIPTYMPTDGGSIVPPGGGDPTVTIEGQPAHPQQVPQLQPQQQGVHMPYPGNAYYGGMTMHPAHPRAHHMGGYQQILGGPQQMPSAPGRNPYQPVYGMPQPPPQMPNMAPYYPAPSHIYPQYMTDEDYRGGRGGRGRGISGRRKPGGRAGRGGRGYHNAYTNNGQNTPHNGLQSPEELTDSTSTNGEVSEPIHDSVPE